MQSNRLQRLYLATPLVGHDRFLLHINPIFHICSGRDPNFLRIRSSPGLQVVEKTPRPKDKYFNLRFYASILFPPITESKRVVLVTQSCSCNSSRFVSFAYNNDVSLTVSLAFVA
ncbi:hypothetical protein NE237_017644 [Protea cynaroides]|uniref:Uncharacterized protein n=1 Tax=Protea cynaroides TaxID=273540 RepID=A0A9Q0K8G8_9MAGN|nr:hypothetical protein NE237_017644 [Protea cynaroides]